MKRRMSKVLSIAFVLVLVIGAFGSVAKGEDLDVIKVGSIQDLTGPASLAGQGNAKGVEYAVEEINAAGGINGRMIELTTLDCKNDANEALNAYRKLVDEVGIHALIGPPLSNSALTWRELVAEDEIPCVGHFMDEACTTDPDTGELYSYMFLAEPGCIQQAYAIAKYAIDELNIKTFAALYNSANAFAIGQAKPFMKYVEAKGGQVLAEETFGWSDTDYRAQCVKIASASPEAVYLSDYSATAKLLIEQLREAGFTGYILGANTLSSSLRTFMPGEDLSKVYFVFNYNEEDESTKAYELAYKYMEDTGTSEWIGNVGFGYDAMTVMAHAMRLANDPTNGPEVRDILETQIKDVEVSGDVISIDPAIHRPYGMGLYIGRHFEKEGVEFITFIRVSEDEI